MLNMPVCVLSEGAGDIPIGDALIVGHKLGIFPDLKEAADRIIKVQEIIEPEETWVKVYDDLYPYYVGMYRELDSCLKRYKTTMDAMDGR